MAETKVIKMPMPRPEPRLKRENRKLREALRNLLRHCDVKSHEETAYERDVAAARKLLSEVSGE